MATLRYDYDTGNHYYDRARGWEELIAKRKAAERDGTLTPDDALKNAMFRIASGLRDLGRWYGHNKVLR